MTPSTEAAPEQQRGKAKTMTVFVNGRPKEVKGTELTFKKVVELSGLPTGPQIIFTISFREAAGKPHEGSMVEAGKPVKIKEGTVFNVESTDRS